MATASEIARLRQVIGGTDLTDEQLGQIIDESANLNEAARWVWRMKSAEYVTLVDVSESGSSRSMSDMFEHALKMAKLDPDGGLPGDQSGRTRTRRIVRE